MDIEASVNIIDLTLLLPNVAAESNPNSVVSYYFYLRHTKSSWFTSQTTWFDVLWVASSQLAFPPLLFLKRKSRVILAHVRMGCKHSRQFRNRDSEWSCTCMARITQVCKTKKKRFLAACKLVVLKLF